MLSQVIKERIEEKFGQPVRYPKDCDALARDIASVTRQNISGSTIKRLLGFVKGTREPRLYTLDLVAEYLGCYCYDDLIKKLDFNKPDEHETIKELHVDTLDEGQLVRLRFDIDAALIMRCLTDGRLEIESSNNCDLKRGDVVKIAKIIVAYPLFVQRITRADDDLNGKVLGKVTGVTAIELLSYPD